MPTETVKFTVTEKAKRPAQPKDATTCFYCHQEIGEQHLETCVLIQKDVKVRYTIEFQMGVPQHWTAHDIAFHLNGSSSCADNILEVYIPEEMERQGKTCLCGMGTAEYVDTLTGPELKEGGR